MMLDVMLRKLAQIEASQSSGLEVKPVRRYHERLVTDVVSHHVYVYLTLDILSSLIVSSSSMNFLWSTPTERSEVSL